MASLPWLGHAVPVKTRPGCIFGLATDASVHRDLATDASVHRDLATDALFGYAKPTLSWSTSMDAKAKNGDGKSLQDLASRLPSRSWHLGASCTAKKGADLVAPRRKLYGQEEGAKALLPPPDPPIPPPFHPWITASHPSNPSNPKGGV